MREPDDQRMKNKKEWVSNERMRVVMEETMVMSEGGRSGRAKKKSNRERHENVEVSKLVPHDCVHILLVIEYIPAWPLICAYIAKDPLLYRWLPALSSVFCCVLL